MFAGAVVDELMGHNAPEGQNSVSANWTLNDSAVMAWSLWRKTVADIAQGSAETPTQVISERLALTMRNTQGGRNLISLGYDSDITLCSQLDQFRIVPELDRVQNCLRAN